MVPFSIEKEDKYEDFSSRVYAQLEKVGLEKSLHPDDDALRKVFHEHYKQGEIPDPIEYANDFEIKIWGED